MFSIGEFARLGGVSVRTLRHYDEIGLLRPAQVDPVTGYRGYLASQLGQLNRILALKELGLSLTQARRLLDGITLGELRGMLILRRAQLEHELEEHRTWLLGVEARLRYIAKEGAMPADDITVRKIPAMGVVVIAGQAPALGPTNIVPVVNRLAGQFDQLGIGDRIKEAGPRMIFYEYEHGEDVTVYLALPVAEPPGELPAPAQYRVLPEIEAAVTVRSGPAASIFPVVYHDLIRWIDERGYRAAGGPGREVWVHEVDDVADVAQQVFEIQLPFTRPGTPAAELAMRPAEELAAERTRGNLRLAEQLRYSRRLRTLRKARRMELRAERRLIAAWRRAAELRGATEPADWRLSEHSGLVIVVVLGGVRPISLVTHRPYAGTDNGLMIEVDPGHFEEMVITALDGLPEEFGRLMQNVAVIVEHDPGPPGLLGLYEGIPLTSRTSDYAGVLPDRITIYRREVCAICRSEQEVADQVRRTVVHEIAHHFGIDDDRLTELGW